MNNEPYPSLVLANYLGLISTAPIPAKRTSLLRQQPSGISKAKVTTPESQGMVTFHRQHATYRRAMVKHHKTMAAEYRDTIQFERHEQHKALVKYHETLAVMNENTAVIHEMMAGNLTTVWQ